MTDDLIDQPSDNQKKFNKNNLLYALCFVVFIGFMFKQMHWPGSGVLLVVGGGLSVGYCGGLLIFFKQHFLFEVLGMILYAAIISSQVVYYLSKEGVLIFLSLFAASTALTFILLKDRKIT